MLETMLMNKKFKTIAFFKFIIIYFLTTAAFKWTLIIRLYLD